MSKLVPCEFEDCPTRVPVEDFDEAVWLPVFKSSREHMGFLCPQHVGEIRAGGHQERYVMTSSEGMEMVIDLEPLTPEPPIDS